MPTEVEPAPIPAKPRRKKLLVFIAGGLILVSGAAGAAWVVMQRQHAETSVADPNARKPQKQSIFTPLDSFTVNLQDAGGDHYAQIGVTLELEDAAIESDLKARLPALRNNILLLIASKQTEDLLSLEGKQMLARQIGVRAAQAIGVNISDADLVSAPAGGPQAPASQAKKPKVVNPIKDVLFSQFLVQ